MKIDIASEIGATTRTVVYREHEGRPVCAVRASRVYDTDIDDLWNALTTKERIARWFAPVSGDLRLGGRYQVEGNAGGTITRCEEPRAFALTWEFMGDVSQVSVALSQKGDDKTLLELEHLVNASGDHWNKYGPGAVGVGWDLAIYGLAWHIATGDRVSDPAFLVTPEAKALMRRSSDDWARASIEGGADPEIAKAVAAATAAAFTGESGAAPG